MASGTSLSESVPAIGLEGKGVSLKLPSNYRRNAWSTVGPTGRADSAQKDL